MANFSTNQVKQFYVAKDVQSTPAAKGDVKFAKYSDSVLGDVILMKHVGEGGLTVTDRMPLASLKGVGIKAAKMEEKLNVAYVAAAAPIAGQQYILKIKVRQFVGISDADTYDVFADYTAKSGDTAQKVLTELAVLLAKNLSKLAYPLFRVYVTTVVSGTSGKTTSGTPNTWEVTPSSSVATLATQNLQGLIIEAYPQDYRRGIMAQDNTQFDVAADTVISAGNPVAWATITKNADNDHIASAIKNNKKIADLEYFCMGERGDIYRGVGFPNNIETKYMIDANGSTDTYGYDIIELTFAYQGDAEDIQKSPKEIVIACPAPSAYGNTCSAYKVVSDLNTAAGTIVVEQIFNA